MGDVKIRQKISGILPIYQNMVRVQVAMSITVRVEQQRSGWDLSIFCYGIPFRFLPGFHQGIPHMIVITYEYEFSVRTFWIIGETI